MRIDYTDSYKCAPITFVTSYARQMFLAVKKRASRKTIKLKDRENRFAKKRDKDEYQGKYR